MNNDEIRARFGVTEDQLDEWAAEYESDDWSAMRFGEVSPGRPKVFDEPLDSITVKVPRSRVAAMRRISEREGVSRSDFIRRAIDNELIAASR